VAQKYIFSIGWGKKYHSSKKKEEEKTPQKTNEIFQKKELDMRKQSHIFISFLLW
jgi:hypothetical protein